MILLSIVLYGIFTPMSPEERHAVADEAFGVYLEVVVPRGIKYLEIIKSGFYGVTDRMIQQAEEKGESE